MTSPAQPDVRTGLASSRFFSFLVAQFLGAANDNAFKISLSLFILARLTDEVAQVRATSLAAALFPLPFLIFSPLAGFLADRFPKDRMLALTTMPEILAMLMAVVGYAANSLPLLMLALFLGATQSAFFSPVKYGLLPEALEQRQLSLANGILEMTTNIAILRARSAEC